MTRIIARRDDGTEQDVTEAVQITYDCLRASLDWGSGFLDEHEINQVVLLAEAAGFPDFERVVGEVWAQRNPDAADHVEREAWDQTGHLPIRGSLASREQRDELLREIHQREGHRRHEA